MPKIEVYKSILLEKIGKDLTNSELISFLEMVKAEVCELDMVNDKIKIEFNDTNRPDLWSYTGLARQIKTYLFGELPLFKFFSMKDNAQEFYGEILVGPEVFSIRPFIFGFLAKGIICNEQMLETLIQLQEKLCYNYGQKRKRVAMGMYASGSIEFPLSYIACNADYRFIPLGMDTEMSIKDINKKHPKGIEYASILENFSKYPLLLDCKGNVLSYPPVVNSHDIGALKVGDSDLFVEVSGNNLEATLLSLSVVACDFYDMGFEILPVKTIFPEETLFGQEIVCPYYFQDTLEVNVDRVNRVLGSNFTVNDMCLDLKKLGVSAYFKELGKFYIIPPVYRNDFLHEVDVMEEIMISRGLSSFKPELPKDFTLGKLSLVEEFSRKIKNLLIGMGFQEMIYNYLGSRRDFIEKMNIEDGDFLSIANPMTEGYEYVRGSIVPNLLKSESISSNFPYPHKIFEIGKVALKDLNSVDGTVTYDNLAFLMADREVSFNEINSLVASLFYYLNIEFELKESSKTLYICGRGADILIGNTVLGSFGEVSPYILSNFGIIVPCCVLEVNINKLLY
ncbi:phenylalanine--tRNA ligase subunit beta [Borrelia anserina]|uniref:Phenylalanine--tRNA ligase beta subunit n=2 Tax=Borrelia anserina TaxID=143 RepID=W5SMU7_BORAN|nr:phenylalanine--tRNA ligase subunit beta [Borrelia anserina]AHH08494.1 Phenylalanyl-tRNA synthetase beta chain [Borrelia anserina BA2]APR64964.1 phenylalanine--tRNA ligase subunit beta [Borrelia anserina Es]UPA06887.1 phenylalanine--tRNA ligase subunit beta [Borrelia anserina]